MSLNKRQNARDVLVSHPLLTCGVRHCQAVDRREVQRIPPRIPLQVLVGLDNQARIGIAMIGNSKYAPPDENV
jgi:hypothetical protein